MTARIFMINLNQIIADLTVGVQNVPEILLGQGYGTHRNGGMDQDVVGCRKEWSRHHTGQDWRSSSLVGR